jgi:hypothetical protein
MTDSPQYRSNEYACLSKKDPDIRVTGRVNSPGKQYIDNMTQIDMIQIIKEADNNIAND